MAARNTDPAEQLARELAREAAFLPERWRLWLFQQLREDSKAIDLEQRRIDQLNKRMSEAVAALDRVAAHLELGEKTAQLALTMSRFNAAPETVRQGWKARRVAEAVRGSWQLAKAVAFNGERLPVTAERQWEIGKGLSRKRREAAYALSAIQEWLETKPTEKTMLAYEDWRRRQNATFRASQKPLPGEEAVRTRWPYGWQEIVQAVEEGRIPSETLESDLAKDEQQTQRGGDVEAPAVREHPALRRPENYVLDSELRSRRLREARKAKGLPLIQVAKLAGIDRSHLGKIENGATKQTTFETIVRLAQALDLTLEDFVTPDPE